MNPKKVKPSWTLYLLAAAMLAGAVFAGIWSAQGLIGGIQKMAGRRIVAPTREEIVFDRPGRYTISHEYRTILNERPYRTPCEIDHLQCRVVSKATGQEVDVWPLSHRSTYSLGRRKGVGMYWFRIDSPGPYEFQAEFEDGAAEPKVVLTIGQTAGLIAGIGTFTVGLVLTIALGLGALGVAIPTFFVRLVRKRRGRRQAAEPYGMPPPAKL